MRYIKSTTLFTFFLSLAIVLAMLPRISLVYADVLDYLNTTVKISICGNKIVEGGEDCEGTDLNNQTCESLGYGPGTLVCDIACSFDTSGCSPAPTPTPTPTPTASPTPTVTPTSTPTPAASSETTSSGGSTSSVETPASTLIPQVSPVRETLPALLTFFDINGSGRIESAEIFTVVKIWVEEWKKVSLTKDVKVKRCDLNRDSQCDLRDLSILLFYVER